MVPDTTDDNVCPSWLRNLFQWYNNLHWGIKIGVGLAALIAAIGLTALSGGAIVPLLIGAGVAVVGGALCGGIIASALGGDFRDGAFDGLVEGVLWSGVFAVGQLIGRAIKIARHGVVIGESMTRVNAAAREIGAATYGAPGKHLVKVLGKDAAFRANKALNRAWITRMMRWRVKIVDIGIDVARPVFMRSPFYALEYAVVNGYNNLILMLWP